MRQQYREVHCEGAVQGSPLHCDAAAPRSPLWGRCIKKSIVERSAIWFAGLAGVKIPAIVFVLVYQNIAKEIYCDDVAQGSPL